MSNLGLTKKHKPRFDVINKYNITIKSLRNQLAKATDIDELTAIAAKIIELEHSIMLERSAGYRQIEYEQKKIAERVNMLQRSLQLAEMELSNLTNKLDFKLNGYRAKLEEKVENLSLEYSRALRSVPPTPIQTPRALPRESTKPKLGHSFVHHKYGTL